MRRARSLFFVSGKDAMKQRETIYGLMAEFTTPEQLLEAAQHTHDAGYRRIDAFAPFPIEGLARRRRFSPHAAAAGGFDRGNCRADARDSFCSITRR